MGYISSRGLGLTWHFGAETDLLNLQCVIAVRKISVAEDEQNCGPAFRVVLQIAKNALDFTSKWSLIVFS